MIQTNFVKRDVFIKGSIEKVWKALTDANELKKWYARACQLDFRVGGKIDIAHGWGAYTTGTITEIIPNKQFTIEQDGGECYTITTLTPEDSGVRVTIEYQMAFIGEDGQLMKENMAYGTYQFMKNLKSVIEEDIDIRDTMWKAWIGAQVIENDKDGVRVLYVQKDSPAEKAGLEVGDVVNHINGVTIQSYADLQDYINGVNVGMSVKFQVSRKNLELTLSCEIASYPRAYSA